MTLSDIIDEIKHVRIRVCELDMERYSNDQKKMKIEEINRVLYRLEKQLIQVVGKSMYNKHD